MRVLVTGASGFVGGALVERLLARGDSVVATSRRPARAELPAGVEVHAWDPAREAAPAATLSNCDAVVHLAGESVVGRWTEAKRRRIRDSRITGTANLVAGLRAADPRPRVWVGASAIGFYGDRGERELTEIETAGDDFLARTCVEWERSHLEAASLGARVALLRIGLVLHPEGGALGAMLPAARFGLGGPLGSGRQWWSWIHRDDLVGLILHALDHPIEGAHNATAPAPVRQREFASTLGRVLGRPALLPAPAVALKLVLGGFSAELLGSKRVVPQRTLASGFDFAHPGLEGSLRDLLG